MIKIYFNFEKKNYIFNTAMLLMLVLSSREVFCESKSQKGGVNSSKSEYTFYSDLDIPGFAVVNKHAESVVQLIDNTKDNIPDEIRYTHFDHEGKGVFEVSDCGIDGIPDVRFYFGNPPTDKIEIFIRGFWYSLYEIAHPNEFIEENNNNKPKVTLAEGESIQFVNGCYRIVSR